MAANSNKDSRGIARGSCVACSCDGYDGGTELKKCVKCYHPPGKHQNMSASPTSSSVDVSVLSLSPDSAGPIDSTASLSPFYQCTYPGCSEETHFDLNTGIQSSYCHRHLDSMEQAPFSPTTDPFSSFLSSSGYGSRCESDSDTVGGEDGLPDSSFSPPPAPFSGWSLFKTDVFSSLMTSTQTDGVVKPHRSKKAKHRASLPPQPPPMKLPVATPPTASPVTHAPVAAPMTDTSSVPPSMSSPGILSPPTAPAVSNPVTSLSASGQQTCMLPGCKRPRYVDTNGKVHDCCGITHAKLYAQQGAPPVAAELQCKTPGCPRQRFQNTDGRYFDYCSLSCRNNGQLLASPSTPNLQSAGYGPCSLPGCTRPRYRDPANQRVHEYCGRTHAAEARKLGIVPSNSNNVVRQANRSEFSLVSQKFTSSWKKGSCPKVDSVYVVSNSALESRWTAYKQQLQDQTVEEYYHGTKLTCDLSNAPCTDQECGICGISNTGLDRRCIRKNINFQRFGHGFYLAPHSSKCHDYTQGANGYRAMLLCSVCPGTKYNILRDNVKLKGPPQGYNCVFGQAGQSLNYEEIVVYNPDAVVPRYIIVYQRNGVAKIAK